MGNNNSTTGYHRLSPPSDSLSKSLLEHGNKVTQNGMKQKANPALGTEVAELKSRIAKLETSCPSCTGLSEKEKAIEAIKMKNTALEKKIMELTATINEMRRSTYGNAIVVAAPESAISNPDLIPDLIDLDPISVVNNPSYDNVISTEVVGTQPMVSGQEIFQIDNNPMNDLNGCIMVLIFLLAMLIGVHL